MLMGNSDRQRRMRSNAEARRAIDAMRNGQTLRLEYIAGERRWYLSGGKSVPAAVAAIVIDSVSVVPAGDGSFQDLPGQVWGIAE
jgi:hypothetical protein